jgi:hypothetical protein
MLDDARYDAVEKFVKEQKSLEDDKQVLIAELLKQKEAAMKEFDEQLANLGYRANRVGRPKRSHPKTTAFAEAQTKPRAKA